MKRTSPRALWLAGLLAGSVVLTGCGTTSEPSAAVAATATATPEASAPASMTSSESAASDTATGLPLTAESSIDAALAKVPGGAVVAGSRTREAGQLVWSVVVRHSDGSGSVLYFDAATGDLVRERATGLRGVAGGTLPALSAQEGIAAAVQAVPGGEVVEFGLETKNGVTAWYVKMISDETGLIQVYVNADTGAIIAQEPAN